VSTWHEILRNALKEGRKGQRRMPIRLK